MVGLSGAALGTFLIYRYFSTPSERKVAPRKDKKEATSRQQQQPPSYSESTNLRARPQRKRDQDAPQAAAGRTQTRVEDKQDAPPTYAEVAASRSADQAASNSRSETIAEQRAPLTYAEAAAPHGADQATSVATNNDDKEAEKIAAVRSNVSYAKAASANLDQHEFGDGELEPESIAVVRPNISYAQAAAPQDAVQAAHAHGDVDE